MASTSSSGGDVAKDEAHDLMCSDGSESGDDDGDMEEDHQYEYGDLEAASEDADASDMASSEEADWRAGWRFAEVLPVLLVVLLRRIKRPVKHVSSHYIVFSGRGGYLELHPHRVSPHFDSPRPLKSKADPPQNSGRKFASRDTPISTTFKAS